MQRPDHTHRPTRSIAAVWILSLGLSLAFVGCSKSPTAPNTSAIQEPIRAIDHFGGSLVFVEGDGTGEFDYDEWFHDDWIGNLGYGSPYEAGSVSGADDTSHYIRKEYRFVATDGDELTMYFDCTEKDPLGGNSGCQTQMWYEVNVYE